jgi:hypothetical protein
MFTKTGLMAGAIALMVGAAAFATSTTADARSNGYHGSASSTVATRFAGRPEIVPASSYRFGGEGYRRFGRYEPRWLGYRHWHHYAWFRHFHHHRWFHRYGLERNFYEG